eukprot:15091541-Alexandrium_andersonii.AAC.1
MHPAVGVSPSAGRLLRPGVVKGGWQPQFPLEEDLVELFARRILGLSLVWADGVGSDIADTS